jgi:hypothetical protein
MPAAPEPPHAPRRGPIRARRWLDTILYWLIVGGTVVLGHVVLVRTDVLPVQPPMLGVLLRTAALGGCFLLGVKLAGWKFPAVAARFWS